MSVGLDKTKKKNWIDGDTFAVKIENHSKEYDGRYIILIKNSYEKDGEDSSTLNFRAKITKSNILPKNEQELNELEYIKTRKMPSIERLLPATGRHTLKEAMEKVDSENTFYEDEYGYLTEYIVRLYMKRGIGYSNFIYLGNYNILPPKDEYFTDSEAWFYHLEYLSDAQSVRIYYINRLLDDYENNNLKKGYRFTKEGRKSILKTAQEHVEMLYAYFEYLIKEKQAKKEKYSLKNGWGTDLYECDLAIDIEDDFTELYNVYMNRKMTKDELVQEMEKRYNNILNDQISGPVFWIILADQQWPNKVLTEYTKEKALEAIEQDLVNWKDKEGYSQRKEELDLLKEELENYIFNK